MVEIRAILIARDHRDMELLLHRRRQNLHLHRHILCHHHIHHQEQLQYLLELVILADQRQSYYLEMRETLLFHHQPLPHQ